MQKAYRTTNTLLYRFRRFLFQRLLNINFNIPDASSRVDETFFYKLNFYAAIAACKKNKFIFGSVVDVSIWSPL